MIDRQETNGYLARVGLPLVDEATGKNFLYSYQRHGESEERTITGQIAGCYVTRQVISIISPALTALNVSIFCIVPVLEGDGVKWYISPGGSEPPQIKSVSELDTIKMPVGTLKILNKEVVEQPC